MQKVDVSIRIKSMTRNRLRKLKFNPGESYDSVINRFLKINKLKGGKKNE